MRRRLRATRFYASRQARTIQNAERERVARVWLVTDDPSPAAALLAEHPDLAVARVPPRRSPALPEGADRIYLIDPLGNFVLAWPSKPDIKAMAQGSARACSRASQHRRAAATRRAVKLPPVPIGASRPP